MAQEQDAERLLIDNLRQKFDHLNCKRPDQQDVSLHLDDSSGLAVLTLKSGPKNALSGRMISKLTELLDQLEQWPKGKGLLIMGADGNLCSGSDLISVRDCASSEAGLALAKIMQFNLARIRRLPMVSVAWIQGFALGGGAELALATDMRLVSDTARLGFVHLRMGICCGWGGTTGLVELVGPGRAIEILSSSRRLEARETIELGLAQGLAQTRQEALDFLENHTRGPHVAIRALKASMEAARMAVCRSKAVLDLESKLFASLWGQTDHLAALNADVRHRDPSAN